MRSAVLRRVWAKRRRILLGLIGGPILLVLVMAVFTPLPAELREPTGTSVRVLARDGTLLREVRTSDGAKSRPLPLASFPPHVRNAVLAAEDRHFYWHPGIDPIAVLRAAGSNVFHLRIMSGASTITMQLARTLRPHPRSMWGKIGEVALALRIEASLSKDQILEAYLNRVTYGPNVRGFATASQAYLGTEPEALSVAGAALIAGLPRGPSLYDVRKRPQLAKKRRDRILERMEDASMIDKNVLANALSEPLGTRLEAPGFGAPHFVRFMTKGSGTDAREIRTTIDPEIQRAAEVATVQTLATLKEKHVTAASVVVLDNEHGDVLGWVGSPDFNNEAALGQNDGVLAKRQPGSALKPFVYAEAMASLQYTGATLLPDVEIHIPLPGGGDYVPHDYDSKHRGPVRLREALGNSLNIPAVYTIHQIGTQRALDRLHAMGFASLTEDAEHYGPALALGDGEVTLLELANAYATLARGGMFLPTRTTATGTEPEAKRVLDERIATMVTDILADKSARLASFGDQNVLELDFDVAVKTGTSKGYRDNVAVGYTRALTVAVWVGNFDASPMANISGITGAGPIFRSVMTAAMSTRKTTPLLTVEDRNRVGLVRTEICPLSGEIPNASCPHHVYEWLREGDAEHAAPCNVHVGAGKEHWGPPFEEWAKTTGRPLAMGHTEEGHSLRVTYPLEGQSFLIDPDQSIQTQVLDIKVEPDEPGTDVRVDGVTLGTRRGWQLAAGEHAVSAARNGKTHIVHFRVR